MTMTQYSDSGEEVRAQMNGFKEPTKFCSIPLLF